MSWRAVDGMLEPVKLSLSELDSCPSIEQYPTPQEAWTAIRNNVSAGVMIAGRDVARCREALAYAEKNAGDMAIEYGAVERNYQAWLAKAAAE